jgi:hypothetical protein
MTPRSVVAAVVALTALGACSGAAAAPGPGVARTTRVFKQRITAPAQFDLALAEISFGRSAHAASSRPSSLALGLQGPTGLDYVAGAVTRFSVRGRPRALVLVVNKRPRGSLAADLAWIGLTVTAARRLGAPVLLQIANPFTRPSRGLTPALCDLPIRGAALTAGDLRAVLSRGSAPSGFGAAAAIAQAYDAVCGRPYAQAFRQAVTQGSLPTCETGRANAVPCCPPNAMCVPPPCPPCPCTTTPCPVAVKLRAAPAIVCPLARPPVVCPL